VNGPRDRRERGLALLREVYGIEIDDVTEGRLVEATVDHLFGEVWAKGSLTVRDRRLLIIGVLATLDIPEVMALNARAALRKHEMTAAQLREVVVLLAHYVGWPRATRLNATFEAAIDAAGSSEDPGRAQS
jgi:4-carboxymuconolactone decarboxylase